jgi:hypothetical protein
LDSMTMPLDPFLARMFRRALITALVAVPAGIAAYALAFAVIWDPASETALLGAARWCKLAAWAGALHVLWCAYRMYRHNRATR